MKLRQWQIDCISQAYSQYSIGDDHFLCHATPGAGKTTMASQLARKLFESDLIDLVICFSPSLVVSSDFKQELENKTGKRLDAKLGASGCSITYQAMLNLSDDFWQLFIDQRVFVIFDEIHHCSGSDVNNANAWGHRIISQIQGRASYTLALSGTPWRSDSIPITLSRYSDNGIIHCDYSYGIAQAISDRVCRTPSITLIDNDNIGFTKNGEALKYKSFSELLDNSDYSYQSLVENEVLILHLLRKANSKLDKLRINTPDAGGLIVASSVTHARRIHKVLQDNFKETADIVTYLEKDSIQRIQNYKNNTKKWIISVGMISEGTNLPRLQVCCHLTRIKTELHFRQVLGRILRSSKNSNENGFLYMPAEPTLTDYAYRLNEDIPGDNIVNFDKVSTADQFSTDNLFQNIRNEMDLTLSSNSECEFGAPLMDNTESILVESYETTLDIFGRFKHIVLKFNESQI